MKQLRVGLENRISLIYVLVAGTWIFFLNLFVMSTYEGWGGLFMGHLVNDLTFLLITTLLLNGLLRFELRRRKSVEERLAVEQSQNEWISNQLPLLVWSTDRQFQVQKVVGTALDFLPYDALRYLRSPAQPFLDDKQVYLAHKAALRGVSTNSMLVFGEHVFDVRVAPLLDEAGRISGCTSVALDVTENIQSYQELWQSERRFRILADATDDAVFTLDRSRRVTSIYGRWLHHNHLSAEQFIGRQLDELLGSASEDHFSAISRALRGESVQYRWKGQIHGQNYHVQMRLMPLYNPDMEVTGVVGAWRDADERDMSRDTAEFYQVRVNEQMQESAEELRQTNYQLLEQIAERQRAEAEEHKQRRIAEALRDVAAVLNSSLKLDQILDHLMDSIGLVIPHDALSIMLGDSNMVRMTRSRNVAHVPMQVLEHVDIRVADVPYLSDMLRLRTPVCLKDTTESGLFPGSHSHAWIRSCVGAPILVDDEVIGFIHLGSHEPAFFDETSSEHLQLFVNQVAIAIKNANTHENALKMVAIEERQRIARDLHDAVTQTLFSASVVSETLLKLWPDKPERVQPGLEHLHHLTRGALAEMRALLLELRPDALAQASLEELVRQLAGAFYSRTKQQVTVVNKGVADLPIDVKEALYRIVQESLNNISKHARATEVSCRMCVDEAGRVCVLVEDNGRGFDPRYVPAGHVGIEIMKERAEGIGAEVEVESAPGKGTRIKVVWSPENVEHNPSDDRGRSPYGEKQPGHVS